MSKDIATCITETMAKALLAVLKPLVLLGVAQPSSRSKALRRVRAEPGILLSSIGKMMPSWPAELYPVCLQSSGSLAACLPALWLLLPVFTIVLYAQGYICVYQLASHCWGCQGSVPCPSISVPTGAPFCTQ